jgi:hypothetical protein
VCVCAAPTHSGRRWSPTHACVCVCLCVCVCVCAAPTHNGVCVCVCVNHTHMYQYTHVHMHPCMHPFVYTRTTPDSTSRPCVFGVCRCVCMCVCVCSPSQATVSVLQPTSRPVTRFAGPLTLGEKAHTHAHRCTYKYLHTDAHTLIHTNIRKYAHTRTRAQQGDDSCQPEEHTHTHTDTRRRTHARTHPHTSSHTHTHTHTHTQTHTHTHTQHELPDQLDNGRQPEERGPDCAHRSTGVDGALCGDERACMQAPVCVVPGST